MVYGGPQPHFGADLLRQQEDYGSHHRDPAHVIFMGSMNWHCVGFSISGVARPSPARPSPTCHFARPPELHLRSFASMSRTLPVMEAFYTLQGEGVFAGQAAYFIRLGGCDVGCTWCDVKESWDAEAHPKVSVEAIVEEAASHPGRIAVITGGEPLMHDLGPLTSALRTAGLRTHLETSGTHPLSGEWHHICFSPKKFKAPLPEIRPAADELKVIVFHKHDLIWAQEQAAGLKAGCARILQPEWSRRDEMMPLMVEFVKKNPEWRISLQTHKYLNIP